MKQANAGLSELASMVDTVIQIPNDRLLELAPKGTSVVDAFRNADDVLRQAVQGISDIITVPGLINRDFSDIRTIMVGMGFAMMGTASAKGENAAVEAAQLAINSPLLEEGGVRGARAMLDNNTGSSQLTLHDVNEACMLIRAAAEYDEVHLSFGIVMNEAMQDTVKITVIATGFEREGLPTIARRAKELAASDPFAAAAPTPEPMFVESVSEEATVAAQSEEQQEFFTPEPEPADELDVPAFLRKERRMVQ